MNLNEQLTADLKVAMKTGDTLTRDTIRGLRSAIKNTQIDTDHPMSEDEVMGVLLKQAKQRRDATTEYQKADRQDLADQELAELAIIEKYLPKQLSDEELADRARQVIDELGVTDMKGMGQVMKRLTANLKGLADGKRISAVVRELLSA